MTGPRCVLMGRQRPGGKALVAALVMAGVTGCTGGSSTPAATPAPPPKPAPAGAVQLGAAVVDHLTIGMVISSASAPGEGAEWRDAAEGARVATRRFQLGGTAVDLVAVNDKGTAQGGAAAVSTLMGRNVAGIVLASSGPHLQGALDKAAQAQVPVLLPYAEEAGKLPAGAWLTGPTTQTVDVRLVEALHQRDITKPFLVDAGGGPVGGLAPSGRRAFKAGGDQAALGKALAQRRRKKSTSFDAVVVSGPAELQAAVVQGLQGGGVDVPFFLTPEALSPAFPVALRKVDGSLSGQFVSAGLDDGDAAALKSSAAGRALAAYFSGVRLTAADPETMDLLGDRSFSAVAGAADVRSHDAVVSLVRAAEKAGSNDPAKVAQALSGLTLTDREGLAGPALNFSTAHAIADDAVVAIAATPDSPGLRPQTAADSPALFWFPVPAP